MKGRNCHTASKQQTQPMAGGTQKGFFSQVPFRLASPDQPNSGCHLAGAQGWGRRPPVPASPLLTLLGGMGRLITGWEGVESEGAPWPSLSVPLVVWSVPSGVCRQRQGRREEVKLRAAVAHPAPPTRRRGPPLPLSGQGPPYLSSWVGLGYS